MAGMVWTLMIVIASLTIVVLVLITPWGGYIAFGIIILYLLFAPAFVIRRSGKDDDQGGQ